MKRCCCHLLWWMQLQDLKRKTHKVHMNENPIKDFKSMFIKQKHILKNQKIFTSKILLKIRSNRTFQKSINLSSSILLRKYFTLDFIISFLNIYLITIKILK
jgi:hypothetical protein